MIFRWFSDMRSSATRYLVVTLTSGVAILGCACAALLDYANLRRETLALECSEIVAMTAARPCVRRPLQRLGGAYRFPHRPAVANETLVDVNGKQFASSADTMARRHLPLLHPIPGTAALVHPRSGRGQGRSRRIEVVYRLVRLQRHLVRAACVHDSTLVAMRSCTCFPTAHQPGSGQADALLSQTADGCPNQGLQLARGQDQ